ncbi:GTP-binding protein [Suttonella ornithocola]|uniref:Small GTP-binding protein domain n=1 Tax=Suttonella ornithocola TaxID=279832 RepID=A0A380MU12_9GAMM|nr:GTP-binding protein [Suttonella ornithocola]SUO95546.1 small GTP-binding protein domain [Suttonella ornithocola]
MKEFKIIFAGSMGAGKTTAIQSLSDKDVVSTDVANTDKKSHSKLLTTVGIDYGQILLPPDIKIGLYGTPGQERFELVWRIVTEGALGAIILVDAASEKAPKELPYYVEYFHKHNMENIVIGITHTDMPGYLSLSEAFELLSERNLQFPVFEVDAREKDDVLLLIETLIASLEAEVN